MLGALTVLGFIKVYVPFSWHECCFDIDMFSRADFVNAVVTSTDEQCYCAILSTFSIDLQFIKSEFAELFDRERAIRTIILHGDKVENATIAFLNIIH